MDFVTWCDTVLRALRDIGRSDPNARAAGISVHQLASSLFDGEIIRDPGYYESSRRLSMFDALKELHQIELIELSGGKLVDAKVSQSGRDFLRDPVRLWQSICSRTLDADEEAVVRLVNRLSSHEEDDHAALRWCDAATLLAEIGTDWTENALEAVARELEDAGLVDHRGYMSSENRFRLRTTYAGLVWETRRAYTLDAQLIDRLVEEWETTSVEHKRELSLDTASHKAEFIKDILGLANTQASGKRWLVIGFDDRTHEYHAPPNPKLKQDHLEHLVAECIEPALDLRYRVVDHPKGRVGLIEVRRERTKLPYRVKKSLGPSERGTTRIEQGEIFVRHGSQTARASPEEIAALEEEARRARENAGESR